MITTYHELDSFVIIILLLPSMQVRHLAVMFLLEVGHVLFVVLLEFILDFFMLWDGLVILWIAHEHFYTLFRQGTERIPLDGDDCCILVLQFLSTIVE